ncbi:type II toxin-antitoxin system CcdA family antitoxin [uncultured Alteromonas sp.]|nr:type II toxin-antitoxin system CcdA family antitoxin [uncultured Alteromonas sp.]
MNLSATLEQALKDKLKSVEAEKWKQENEVLWSNTEICLSTR